MPIITFLTQTPRADELLSLRSETSSQPVLSSAQQFCLFLNNRQLYLCQCQLLVE